MPRITINDKIINKNIKDVQAVQPGVTLKVKYYSSDIGKLYFRNKFGEKQILHERFNRDKCRRLILSEKYRQRQLTKSNIVNIVNIVNDTTTTTTTTN